MFHYIHYIHLKYNVNDPYNIYIYIYIYLNIYIYIYIYIYIKDSLYNIYENITKI